jgi:hypothetical protein
MNEWINNNFNIIVIVKPALIGRLFIYRKSNVEVLLLRCPGYFTDRSRYPPLSEFEIMK